MELETPQHLRLSIGIAVAGFSLLLLFTYVYNAVFKRKPLHPNAPQLTTNNHPIVGALEFFTGRGEMFLREAKRTKTGVFSFYVGREPVVGITGEKARVPYFENHNLSLGEGQSFLFGAGPKIDNEDEGEMGTYGSQAFTMYFAKRLNRLLERDRTSRGLPKLISDVKSRVQELSAGATEDAVVVDPFKTLYKIIFQLTMRFVGCDDIAEDRAWLDKTLERFNSLERNFGAFDAIAPWLPTVGKIKRTVAAGQLYVDLKKIVDNRKKTGEAPDDPLQYLSDNGDSMNKIIGFILGALFAGQLNTGHNAAYIAYYLGRSPEWQKKVRDEVEAAANKHASNADLSLIEKLSSLPISSWEEDFPVMDLCLRETIRVQLMGSSLRKNISSKPVMIGDEVVQPGAFAACQFWGPHLDPDIYPEPAVWDPERHQEGRAEDKKTKYAYIGWGAGRHPCPGMRTAKLEIFILTSFMLAYYDITACDASGNALAAEAPYPKQEINGLSSVQPDPPIHLKLSKRV